MSQASRHGTREQVWVISALGLGVCFGIRFVFPELQAKWLQLVNREIRGIRGRQRGMESFSAYSACSAVALSFIGFCLGQGRTSDLGDD